MIAPMILPDSIPLNPIIDRGGVRDGRARFREILDAVNRASGEALPDFRPTDAILRPLGEEGPATGRSVSIGLLPAHLHVIAVPGFLTECIAFMTNVLSDALAHLNRLGAKTLIAPLAGRGGCAHNAQQLRDLIMALPHGEAVIMIAMSKGAMDALTMLTNHPETHPRITALVSLVGAVCGSPLHDLAPGWLKWLERNLPLPMCARHNGEAVQSLAPATRTAFLHKADLPTQPRYYCLGAAIDETRVSKSMAGTYRALSRLDPLNDGQMLLRDQILPHAEFLGVLNADHIATGMPFNRNTGVISRWVARRFLNRNAFPREVMVEAVVRRVLEDINQH